jgi:TolA-binding protein
VLTIETDDRYLRALTLVQEGRALEARHLLYGIARDQPTSPYYTRAWMAVAESHERENNPQSAAVAYRRATLGPPSPRAAEAQFALAGIRFRTGTREAAIVEYARYLRTYPNGAHASLARAKLCELSEQSYCGN